MNEAYPLRRVARIINGGTPTADVANWDGDVPWATPVDIGANNGGALASTARTLTLVGARSGSTVVPPGSVLVSTRAPIGYVARTLVPMAFNQGCRAAVPNPDIDGRFLTYALLAARHEMDARAQGSTFSELSSEGFASVPVAAARLDEQRRIADFLDTETARLDALMSGRSRQRELLAVRETTALTSILEVDSARRVRLGYLAQLQTGVTVGGQRPTHGLVERPYLRVANVKEDRLELATVTSIWVTPQEAKASTLRPRDVLMTEGGDLDKLGRGTLWNGAIPGCLHQNHVFAIRCGSQILPEYLAYFTRSMRVRAYFAETGVKTTNLASTNSSKVRSLPVPLMSIEQQKERVAAAGNVVQSAAGLRSAIECQGALLAERRQALITAAVTGELDVTTARGASV